MSVVGGGGGLGVWGFFVSNIRALYIYMIGRSVIDVVCLLSRFFFLLPVWFIQCRLRSYILYSLPDLSFPQTFSAEIKRLEKWAVLANRLNAANVSSSIVSALNNPINYERAYSYPAWSPLGLQHANSLYIGECSIHCSLDKSSIRLVKSRS